MKAVRGKVLSRATFSSPKAVHRGFSMRQYLLPLIIALIGFAFSASPISAEEPFGKLAPYWRTPTPYYICNPKTIVPKRNAPPPTAQFTRTRITCPRAYPYGYFGAETRPYYYKSTGYYDSADQTTFGRGY